MPCSDDDDVGDTPEVASSTTDPPAAAPKRRWNSATARERGRRRHGEQPRGVREVEAPRAGAGVAAQQGEHRGVVRASRGLGGEVGPQPQPRAALPRDAHFAHPPAQHAAEHRVPRLPELGAPRGGEDEDDGDQTALMFCSDEDDDAEVEVEDEEVACCWSWPMMSMAAAADPCWWLPA
ncbi:unnamed protein product [Miscanthus lutarioriparius]|uniref:Uncharacterized protein n=1 Tax=Miscanthus lutarioriparius TaxID=422564 RepID=A0A811NGJ6_9POAL|nr:unnamed protein product [Miscanthus lutarioriparius]